MERGSDPAGNDGGHCWVSAWLVGHAGTTRGVVSRLPEESGVSFIQADASINPGHSGGPLFDDCGRVAGVVVSKMEGVGVEGLSFALSEPSLSEVIEDIRENAASLLSVQASHIGIQALGNTDIVCTVTDENRSRR